MTAADDAYQAARVAIAAAKRSRSSGLDLSGDAFRALTALPPEIELLQSLESLRLDNTHVSDLGHLAGMTGMKLLYLSNTPVSDLSPVAAMTGMQKIDLSGTQVSNLGPLAAMTGLYALFLSNTPVSDLSPLANLPGMRTLFLTNTPVTDLAPLSAMAGMEHLELSNTKVSNLAHLTAMTDLQVLAIAAAPVKDLTPLAEMEWLMSVDLSKTQVSDLGPLLTPLANVDTTRWDLRLNGTPAALDPDIAPIVALSDGHERAVALRDVLLRGWQPSTKRPPMMLPNRQPAPLEIAVSDDAITLAGAEGLPHQDTNARAAMGWQALRDYREELATSFNPSNYQPLPNYLAAFDRAMGENYDPARVVRIGVQALRLDRLIKDPDFSRSLPDGVAGDLRGMISEMLIYVNRFPDWVAYRDDAVPYDPDALRQDESDFTAIRQAMDAVPQIDSQIGAEYAAIIIEATGVNAGEEGGKALVTSTNEAARALAEHEADRRRQNRAFARKGGDYIDGLLGPLGVPYHLLVRIEGPMRRLSARYARLAWIGAWYDETFGPDDDKGK